MIWNETFKISPVYLIIYYSVQNNHLAYFGLILEHIIFICHVSPITEVYVYVWNNLKICSM